MRAVVSASRGGFKLNVPFFARRPAAQVSALLYAAIHAGAAVAAPVDLGVPGLAMRWDNTVRFNAGVRVEKPENAIASDPNGDEGNAKFDHGDLVTSRIDLLSELDGTYDLGGSRIGARVSGAGWYDPTYDDKVEFNPAITKPESAPPDGRRETSYFGDRYSSYTRKYYVRGGELLDAFVFGNTIVGGIPVGIKAGRHSLYWGESVFFSSQSVAYSQQPIDGLKASTSPGIETKEVFLPLAQVSLNLQPLPNLALSAQYFLEWKPNRFPEGGTYFASTDFLFDGPDRFPLVPAGTAARFNSLPSCSAAVTSNCRVPGRPAFSDSARRGDALEPDDSGDFGLSARWSPEWAGGPFGLYYRRFDERMPWTGIDFPAQDVAIAVTASGAVALPTSYRLVYPKDTELYGLSYTTNVGGLSVAGEATYRHNTALSNGLPSSVSGSSFGADGEGPRGNLVTALANVIVLLPSTPLYDTGNLVAELAWSHLTSVTHNADNYNGLGYAGCNPTGRRGGAPGRRVDGCSTRDFLGAQMNMEPQWLQVLPGVDLSAPLSYAIGLSGNKQDNGDGFQGAHRYSVGIAADMVQRYRATLAFSDRWAHTGPAQPDGNRDRGWVSLTLKASF
jgi:hypothetical protein